MAGARRDRARRGNIYRERAIKILPWVCAWCGREFSGKKLHELTVHHKDRDPYNNPPDGSNWEMLCLYCHENEHSRAVDASLGNPTFSQDENDAPSTYQPFAELGAKLKSR